MRSSTCTLQCKRWSVCWVTLHGWGKQKTKSKTKKHDSATDDGNIAGPSSQMQKVFLRFRFYATCGFLFIDVVCGAPMCFPISGIGQTGFVIRGFSRVAPPPPVPPSSMLTNLENLICRVLDAWRRLPITPSRKSRRLPQQH